MKILKSILGTLSVLCAILIAAPSANAGKPVGNGSQPGGFTFTYNVGAVANYHAYGLAVAVYVGGVLQPQPPGTVILGRWYVWDLGSVTGTGTVTCPKPITPKGQTASDEGILFFANTVDLGGNGTTAVFTHPVGDVQIFLPKWYNGYAFVGIIEPDGSGLTLYYGPQFTPFQWDLSPYLW